MNKIRTKENSIIYESPLESITRILDRDFLCYDGENILPNVYDFYARAAVLKKLDLNDISLPLDDVSQYLLAKYDD